MPSPYRASSPTVTSAAPSVVHASTSTILHHEAEEFSIKLETERDDESRFDASSSVNDHPRHPDPPRAEVQKPAPLPFLPRPSTDPNVVSWDGPDDPENPQNWSFWYKWWLTTVCTVMTLNVYVSHIPFRELAPDISSAR
jgi:DHA1 family multidrug resistance protein-like MFS transporter